MLGNDMPDIASYVASQKGIYRTDDLIAHAEQHLSARARTTLPPKACVDVRESGRCLAYELSTACAFHLWRAVETTMDLYFEQLTGQTFETAKVARNWGAKIKAMQLKNAPAKITAILDHVRSEYRNPQTHPDQHVSIEEAQRLFPVAMSVIEQLLLEAERLAELGANQTGGPSQASVDGSAANAEEVSI